MKGKDRAIRKEYMFLFVFIITLLHTLMILIWLVYDKIGSIYELDNNKKQYEKCELPKSQLFRFV